MHHERSQNDLPLDVDKNKEQPIKTAVQECLCQLEVPKHKFKIEISNLGEVDGLFDITSIFEKIKGKQIQTIRFRQM